MNMPALEFNVLVLMVMCLGLSGWDVPARRLRPCLEQVPTQHEGHMRSTMAAELSDAQHIICLLSCDQHMQLQCMAAYDKVGLVGMLTSGSLFASLTGFKTARDLAPLFRLGGMCLRSKSAGAPSIR